MELLILPLALLAGLFVLLMVGLVLRVRHGKPTPQDAEYETLRARYARGEITRAAAGAAAARGPASRRPDEPPDDAVSAAPSPMNSWKRVVKRVRT